MEQQENVGTKECNRCHRTLPVTEFYKKSGTPDGLQYVCKECTSEINKAARRSKKAFGGVIPNSHASRHAS